MPNSVPKIRVRKINDTEIQSNGDYVLYWMTAYRRIKWNFSLQRAVEWALELNKPLVILEALRCGYPWASDRIHRFIMDGMAQHARQLKARKSVIYYPYLEKRPGDGKGFLKALSKKACLVVTDDFPCFFSRICWHLLRVKLTSPWRPWTPVGFCPCGLRGRCFRQPMLSDAFYKKYCRNTLWIFHNLIP